MYEVSELANLFLVVGFAIGSLSAAAVGLGCARLLLTEPSPDEEADPTGTDRVIADWAIDAGYDLLSVSRPMPADGRAAAEFGFDWDRPGRIWRVRVQDGRRRVHGGWVFVGGHTADRGEFTPDFLEVAWDE